MKLRTRLYLATIGRLTLAARERELIRLGYWQDAIRAIYDRTGDRERCVAILRNELGLPEDEASNLLRRAMLEDDGASV